MSEQVIIIGAGPCGLAAAIACKQKGIDPLIIEKGALVQSIYDYPTYMIFHSTPELLEIGGVPFTTPHEKPTRAEALAYYRLVAERYELRIHPYETVQSVQRMRDTIQLVAKNRLGQRKEYETKRIVFATGYFDYPNKLGIPGEDLPKVFSYYKEAHPFAGLDVAIVGGNNSAIDAALDLQRHGANVTVIYRRSELSQHVKSWTKPVFESMVNKGNITMYFDSQLLEIHPDSIVIGTRTGVDWAEGANAGNVEAETVRQQLSNDFVFTLIGYQPDRRLMQSIGVHFDPHTGIPKHDPATMMTNIDGVYLAGVVAAGNQANSIFIETGRFHGQLIADHLASKC